MPYMARTKKRAANYAGNKGGECSKLERLAHCLRVDWTCPYCGGDLKTARVVSMDHVLAQVWGGAKSDTNIVACCGSCNSSKKHKLLKDFAEGRGDAAMVARVHKLKRRSLKKYLAQAKAQLGAARSDGESDVPEDAGRAMNATAPGGEHMEGKTNYPGDAEMLGELLEYLDVLSGNLDLLHEHLADGAQVVTLDDGEETTLAPLDALNNAGLDLTRKVMQLRAQRALRDGTLDDATREVLDHLTEDEPGA